MALITITMNDNIEATAAYSEASIKKLHEVQARQLKELKEAEKVKDAWEEINKVGRPLRVGSLSPEKRKALEEKVRALKAKHGIKGGSYQTAIEKVVKLGIDTRNRAGIIKREEKNQKNKGLPKETVAEIKKLESKIRREQSYIRKDPRLKKASLPKIAEYEAAIKKLQK